MFFLVHLFAALGADKLRIELFFGALRRILRFAHGFRHKTLSVWKRESLYSIAACLRKR
jgi:hypothetical protein